MAKSKDQTHAVRDFLSHFPDGFPEGVNVLAVSDTASAVVVKSLGELVFVEESVSYHPPGRAEQRLWEAFGIKEDDMPYVTEGVRRFLNLNDGKVVESEVYETDDCIQGIVYALHGERLPPESYEQYVLDLVKEVLTERTLEVWQDNPALVARLNLARYDSFFPMVNKKA